MFNMNELSTREQAKQLAIQLSSGPIRVGGGVKSISFLKRIDGTDSQELDMTKSGIYIPLWDSQPWSIIPHEAVDGQLYEWLHFRFLNGGEGMNVGLIADKFKRFPFSPLYVLSVLNDEANSLPRG